MRFEITTSLRYLKSTKKSIFTSITTIIAIFGSTISIAAIFITLSIMNGFQSEIRKKIYDFQPNITIYGEMNKKEYDKISELLKKNQHISNTSPFIISQAILLTQTKTSGAVIKGIDIENEFKVISTIPVKYGSWDFSDNGIVLGQELSKNLGVFIGDEIIIVSPKFESMTLGIVPNMKKFKIKGIINTGYYEYDSSFAFIDINDARKFFNPQIITNGVEIKINNIDKLNEAYLSIKKELPFYYSIRTYADINKNLFSALKLEKFIMTLILSLIILISSFTITSNLFMMTVLKTREIGILRAIGVSADKIKKIFFLCGVYILITGMFLGFFLGYISLWIIKKYNVVELPSDIYYITKVPVKIEAMDIIIIILISTILTIISSIYPAKKASKLDPGDVIRYG